MARPRPAHSGYKIITPQSAFATSGCKGSRRRLNVFTQRSGTTKYTNDTKKELGETLSKNEVRHYWRQIIATGVSIVYLVFFVVGPSNNDVINGGDPIVPPLFSRLANAVDEVVELPQVIVGQPIVVIGIGNGNHGLGFVSNLKKLFA